MTTRLNKGLALFLGILMCMFGFLKFLEPFRGWFDAQIYMSHLPQVSILAGKLTEMLTGVLFLTPWVWRSGNTRAKDKILLVACFLLFTQMLVAIYVHLQPGVPASVLPLGIKPPVIPGAVLLLGLLTASGAWKDLRAETDRDARA